MIIKRTPWGAVQTLRIIAEGIVQVSTAGHGGLVLSDERLKAMPERFKLNVYGGGRYFEEDCEWALVALAFPDAFTADYIQSAKETAAAYYPNLAVNDSL